MLSVRDLMFHISAISIAHCDTELPALCLQLPLLSLRVFLF